MAYHPQLFAIIFFFFLFRLNAQDERPYRIYATQQVHQRLLAENLGFASQLASMENHIQNYAATGEGRRDTIPVVFHILYASGQAYPSEAQIQAQLDALNRDFQNYNAPTEAYVLPNVQQLANLAVSPEIYFCLPDNDNSGNLINPVHYVETGVAEWMINDSIKFDARGGASVWEPAQFLNIWVAYLADDKAGYAQMPSGPPATDGIVVDSRYFIGGSDSLINTVYHQGKTLTHLVGSYLGLYDLWNEIEPCHDDYVDDTPIHNSPNYFPGDIFYHISLCDTTYKTEMIMSFMDNTDDEVLNMFTQGQKNRMKAVLAPNGARAGLVSGASLCEGDNFRTSEDRYFHKQTPPSLYVHPNPTTNTVNVQLASPQPGKVLCTALNSLGATVWNETFHIADGSQMFQIDCSAWGQGLYVVMAVFDDGTVAAQKLMVTTP